jgi:FAD/FMN-containing dehydrogenase
MGTVDVAHALRQLIDPTSVLDDPQITARYETDWTGRFRGASLCVVRPRTTDEVAQVVRWCRQTGTAMVPQGGNTGLVGGSVPHDSRPAVVVSLEALDHLGDVDLVSGQVTVGAGVTLARLDEALASTPWEFGVDLGARDSATIGGMVATNAGGLRVLRYGTMRANVLGVEAVLGTGLVVSHLHGLVKDNTGYDLAGLLCGSEGTLGVVTGVRVRLVPRWPDRCVVWMACDSWTDALQLAVRARLALDGLDGLEAVDGRALELVQGELGLPPLFRPTPPVAMLVAWAGRGEPPEVLSDLAESTQHVVGLDAPSWRSLWAYRERVTEAVARLGVPRKFDITLPLGNVATFTDEVRRVDGAQASVLFGHLGDGNLHVNVPGAGSVSDGDELDHRILSLVARHGGSISAEHGIGRHKAPWLHLNRSAEELASFAAIKAALDPAGVMNPGVLLQP